MYQIGKMPGSIDIGYIGETNFRKIEIDMKAWMKDTPDGVPCIVHIRPGETQSDAYVANTSFDTEKDILTWEITEADIGPLEGEGLMQVWLEVYEDDEVVKRGKSINVITKVTASVDDPSQTVPSAQESMLEQMASLKNQTVTAKEAAEDAQEAAEDAAEEAQAAVTNPPYISEDTGCWMVWSKTAGDYVDTGISASGDPTLIIDDEAGEGDTDKTFSADKLTEELEGVKSGIDGVDNSVDDILDHETYTEGGSSEYDPVTENTTISDCYLGINGYGTANVVTPSSTSIKVYPVEIGKTYKVKGKCSTSRPLLVVADSVVTSGAIATTGNYDHVYGASSSAVVEEQEYTALRTGYLYLTYATDCGLWLKNAVQVRKYHMDNVLNDLSDIDSIIDKITRTKIDSTSSLTKIVPRNAEPVAKVTNLSNTVTAVRSILSRNVADKNAVTDVEVSTDHTMKKGIKTVMLPPGRYYLILGNVGAYTMVKRYENGVYSDTMYKEQFPMRVGITDPAGGCFIVYASSVSNLGDLSGLCIIKLHDDETTATFEAYSEKLYTAENLASDNRIDVVPNGIIEFVNSGNTAVASTVEYTVFGKDDDTTTKKDFITSPDGTKFLPMIKNDGSIVGARVIPKKALFIGNSLTSGWQTFGEAATESDKDFVARFGDVVSDLDSEYTFSRKWATNFEQQGSLANAQAWVTTNIDPLLSDDLDLIVVQLSENVVSNASAVATFPESSLWLLQHLRTECPKARVVWMGVWFDRGWVKTLLDNTANTGCEYVDIRPLYLPENVSVLGTVYEMESDYTKEYTVDSFTVDNGQITLVFTVDGVQYTATIPSYTSYTSSSDTSITVTGIYHVVSTYYAAIHPGDEGFRKIANKLLFDLGISDSEETIPADA